MEMLELIPGILPAVFTDMPLVCKVVLFLCVYNSIASHGPRSMCSLFGKCGLAVGFGYQFLGYTKSAVEIVWIGGMICSFAFAFLVWQLLQKVGDAVNKNTGPP